MNFDKHLREWRHRRSSPVMNSLRFSQRLSAQSLRWHIAVSYRRRHFPRSGGRVGL